MIFIKAVVFGVLSAEAFYFSRIIALSINQYIYNGSYEVEAFFFSLLAFLPIIIYLYFRGFFRDLLNVLASNRADIFIAFSAGIIISLSFQGIGKEIYLKIAFLFTPAQIITLVLLPIAFGLLTVGRLVQLKIYKRKENIPFFVSDVELKSKKDDLLNFSDEAERFAERVFNQGSPNSMVFGIDAPWGIGKSTFVNLCAEYWREKYDRQVIIYNFNPLRYEDRDNLLEKFIDGLIGIIQKHSFVPEIRPLVSKYSRFIKGSKGKLSLLGIDFEFLPGAYTIDDAFDDLESVLENLDKKIIIVVDDLDRISLPAIKDVLFVIKKSFTLPNISYVLCYDTENINSLEQGKVDIEKVTEFLEKFVNVKTSLFLDNKKLIDYVEENLSKTLIGNSQADPILVSKAIGGLMDIYKSNDYHLYLPFIGDIRKIKRLINTLLLLEIEKTDFENTDFDKQDLIHLLLIYINYPNIFRKIYNAETQGKQGFFSAVLPWDDDYPVQSTRDTRSQSTYENSKKFTDYLEILSENQKFILDRVFNIALRLKGRKIAENVPTEVRSSYACFNGNDGRNLEQYLNLIIRVSKPQKSNQHKFYVNCKNDIVAGKSIEEVLAREEFSYTKNENSHELLWRVITNSLAEFDNETGNKLILFLTKHIIEHSLFSNSEVGLGLRDDLDLLLTILLNQAGWKDKLGKHRNNTDENVAEIAEWIFGEDRHKGQGILDTLSGESRGILGFYDLIAFRLFCSADRGGDIFNLQRALAKRGNPEAPTQGLVKNIAIEEMREISQKVFDIFNHQYIKKNRNIFREIDSLTLKDFASQYTVYVEEKIAAGEIKNIDDSIKSLKSKMKSFIIYQLGNELINLGVGCGYYDIAGKEDKHGIRKEINDYLFTNCFNPSIDPLNYEHFIDYLFVSFASVFAAEHGRDFIPHINEFTRILLPEMLAGYWKENGEKIKALKLEKRDKVVITANYRAAYKEDMPKVFELLDDLVRETETKADVGVEK